MISIIALILAIISLGINIFLIWVVRMFAKWQDNVTEILSLDNNEER